jgi:hypothetical protein
VKIRKRNIDVNIIKTQNENTNKIIVNPTRMKIKFRKTTNEFVDGDTKLIIREQDGDIIDEILISPESVEKIKKYKWRKMDDYYKSCIDGKEIMLHRFLLNAKPGEIVDHINNTTKDNRLENLRICNSAGNAHNRSKREDASSKYHGVSYHKIAKKWNSIFRKDGEVYRLSSYNDEIQAAIAYNIKAKELYGEFAKLNDIPDDIFKKYEAEIREKINNCKKTSTSGYKGICWNNEKDKWQVAHIKEKKKYHIGYFADLREAIIAYNAKIIELYGENNNLLHEVPDAIEDVLNLDV